MGGFINDLFSGAVAHGKDAWGKIKDDPERAFLGAMTPVGTELWGGVLGQDWQPATTMLGGATERQFQDMEAQGIDTGPKRSVDAIADAVASFYAGGALGDVGGGLIGGTGGSGAPVQGGFMSQIDTGASVGAPVQGGFMSQVNTGGVQSGNPFAEMLRNINLGGGQQTQPTMPGGNDFFEWARMQEEAQRRLNAQRQMEMQQLAQALSQMRGSHSVEQRTPTIRGRV